MINQQEPKTIDELFEEAKPRIQERIDQMHACVVEAGQQAVRKGIAEGRLCEWALSK